MFDLISGQARHMPRHAGVPIVISTTIQVLIAGLVLTLPYLYVTEQLPEIPSMMAFVAAPPPPPPPPPPPAPAPKAPARPAAVAPKPGQLVAPIEAPATVEPEPVATGGEEGVLGGVEGGVPGGVYGGVVGGIPDPLPPPPPPPPPPAAARAPLRVGGKLKAPELIRRVAPEYPPLARDAHYEGLVILEATVNEEGYVEDVRVLRSGGLAGVLDRAAIAAVRQWQYSPLLLNGRRERFVLSVTMSFTLADERR